MVSLSGTWASSPRTWLSPLLVAAALLGSTPASAQQPIEVRGYLDVANIGPLQLVGDRGFSFGAAMAVFEHISGVSFCNFGPDDCVPGATINLRAAGVPSGVVTLDGVLYRVGSPFGLDQVDVEFQASVVLPPLAPNAVVSAPFTFTGLFTSLSPTGPESLRVPLTGSGRVDVYLHSPSGGFPNSWHIDRVVYRFTSPLPSLWTNADVGNVGQPGSVVFDGSRVRIRGSGGDIWGAQDSFHYVFQSFLGSGEIAAKVVSLQNTSPFAKAGVMLRDNLDPSGAHVILDVKPDGGIEFMTRSARGGDTRFITGPKVSFPVWLRLARAQGMVTAYISQDGFAWQALGSTTAPAGTLAAPAGLVVTSHDNSTSAEAIFEQPVVGLEWPWLHQDVGDVHLPGNASFINGRYLVAGEGEDIWGPADAFHFMYQQHPLDVQIVARVLSELDTNPFAKAGVMVREGVSAESSHVILDVRPDGNIEFMRRPATGAATEFIAGATQPFPVWLKLVRQGMTVSGFRSADGSNWIPVGSTDVSMSDFTRIGVVVTSHTASAVNTAAFDHVAVQRLTAGPVSPAEIVIYANDIPDSAIHGRWTRISDSASPNGSKLATPGGEAPSTANALAAPPDYVDVPFTPSANTPYTLWLRVQALNDSKFSDSLWVQLSDAVVNGSAAYPIATTSGLLVNLATDAGATSLRSWGWVNGAYWLAQPATMTFASTGPHILRIQPREYGVAFDQVVLSPDQYFNPSASCPTVCGAAPGPLTDDRTVVPKP